MWLLLSTVIILILILAVAIACRISSDNVKPCKLDGARVVLTGGSEGLGLQLAILLVQKGVNLVIMSRSEAKLATAIETLAKYKKDNTKILEKVSVDVSNANDVKLAIKKASDMMNGGIDILINNAGVTRPGRFEDLDLQSFERCMNINYYGNINCLRAVLPIMKEQRSGRVISVASVLGLFGCMGYSAYCPSKAAIVSLYEALHQEYYPFGISFSVATPASIGTASFFEEEQKIKPEETLLLEKDDPILPPEVVAKPIIDSLTDWRFIISPSGLNSDVMRTSCGGWGPGSFTEVVSQVFLSGLTRLIGLFAFNMKAKLISKAVREKQ